MIDIPIRIAFKDETALRQVNALRDGNMRKWPSSIFRAPRTGLNVQVWLPDDAPTAQADSYEVVTCPACARVHLVNKATGRTLADKEK